MNAPGGRLRRSWLFVPAHRERMVSRAPTSGADVVIFDLEDAVPAAEKSTGRRLLADVLAEPPAEHGPEQFVRISALRTYRDVHDDLDAVVRPGLRGIVVPKVDSVLMLMQLGATLAVWEALRGLPDENLEVIALAESPASVLDARAIGAASPRVGGLAFGAEDFQQAMALPGGPESDVLLHARTELSLAAAAIGIQAIDRVWTDLDDATGLQEDSLRSRQLGYSGKLAIHPRQIDTIHAAMSPTDAEAEHAREIADAFAEAQRKGVGAVVVRGQMVDAPVALRAQRVLNRYAASAPRTELA